MFVSRNRRLAALALIVLSAGACSEKLQEGVACATLCPNQQIVVVDTVLTPADTALTVGGFPGSGLESRLLVAQRGTDLDIRSVIRFDTLPQRYTLTTRDTASGAITRADSTRLRLALDLVTSKITGPATIELYDVDTVTTDTAAGAVLPQFRAARRIGSRTLAVANLLDTVSIPFSDSVLVSKITSSTRRRLRIGIRVVAATDTRLDFYTTESFTSLNGPPAVVFRPSLDTASRALTLSPFDKDTTLQRTGTTSRSDYVVAAVGSVPIVNAPTAVEVGGLPGRRGYLRFALPARFSDSTVTIVRARLELTQIATPGTADTVAIFPLVSLAGRAVSDPQRGVGLVDAGKLNTAIGLFQIDSLLVPTNENAVRSVNVTSAVRYWTAISEAANPHALVLAVRYEGITPGLVRFATGSAAVAQNLRPRLVISFVNRVPFNLP